MMPVARFNPLQFRALLIGESGAYFLMGLDDCFVDAATRVSADLFELRPRLVGNGLYLLDLFGG
jgi:hypothetical protein